MSLVSEFRTLTLTNWTLYKSWEKFRKMKNMNYVLKFYSELYAQLGLSIFAAKAITFARKVL